MTLKGTLKDTLKYPHKSQSAVELHGGEIPASWFEGVAKFTYVNIIRSQMDLPQNALASLPQLLGRELISLVDLVPTLKAVGADSSATAGIYFGARVPESAHGAMAYAASSAATAKQVLQTIGRYTSIRHRFFDYPIYSHQDHYILCLKQRIPLGPYRVFIEQATLYTLLKLMQSALGDTVLSQCKISVTWPDPKIAAMDPLGVALKVEYDQAQSIIALPDAVGEMPCLTGDAQLYSQACRACEEEVIVLSGSVTARVRQLLDNGKGGWRSGQAIAKLLNMSRRTLIRHLHKEGSSYRALIDQARYKSACFYLARTTLSVTQIALNLGYQDASNFSRTFARWSGQSPGSYRRETAAPDEKSPW